SRVPGRRLGERREAQRVAQLVKPGIAPVVVDADCAGHSAGASVGFAHRACGSGLPFVSGRNGAAPTPRMKHSPTIVAALPKPPSVTISVPAISGPAQEIHRGALKQKATAVPRTRVGKSSGSQIGAHDQIPVVKKPKTATATSSAPIPWA